MVFDFYFDGVTVKTGNSGHHATLQRAVASRPTYTVHTLKEAVRINLNRLHVVNKDLTRFLSLGVSVLLSMTAAYLCYSIQRKGATFDH